MRKNKPYSLILAVFIAFGLWLYVVNNISMGDDRTFYNIPVVMEGETVLNERNLMITERSTETVSLHLSGTRSDLNKVNSGNITIKVDLSKIYEPGERIALSYYPSYPGDVPSNAFVVESKNPSYVYVDVDYRRVKEIPVQVVFSGSRSESFIYDTENVILDNSLITVTGPAGVIDQVHHAEVEIDLTDRGESVSESLRYTLCDENGEPVDAERITTNVEEVRVDMPIQRIKQVTLLADVVYGGGAAQHNTSVTIEPSTIRVSGGEAVLAEFGDTYTVGTIYLSDLEKVSNVLMYPISLPEGVTNQTGVAEAAVTVVFSGLKTKDVVLDEIASINVPEGMAAEIINANLTVKVRGPASEIDRLTADHITASVDFSDAEVGNATYRVTLAFHDGFKNVGPMKSVSVSATVTAVED